jgi:hypothetical protein
MPGVNPHASIRLRRVYASIFSCLLGAVLSSDSEVNALFWHPVDLDREGEDTLGGSFFAWIFFCDTYFKD